MPHLRRSVQARLRGDPVRPTSAQARVLDAQLRETASIRGWDLLAVAIMANHVHVVVGVGGDPEPATLLRDFKSWRSRRLSERWPKPAAGTWWTASGSTRRLATEPNALATIDYVRNQERPLVVWTSTFEGDEPAETSRSHPRSADRRRA